MSKVSLIEARQIIADIELVDYFYSVTKDRVSNDTLKLHISIDLYDKIHQAEKEANILYVRHQIKLLQKEADYYRPQNAVFYYKESITEDIRSANADRFNKLREEIEKLKKNIEIVSSKIYIEVNE